MCAEPVSPNAGYYGKIPAVGDFVRHNLGRAFIEPWDDWLQQAIAAGREQMGEQWLQAYLTSPIYRFVLTPGICGEQAWKGVIMPSVDRVGRYFPLTLCSRLDSGINPFEVILGQSQWFEHAERLILSTLEDDLTLEQLQQDIARLDQLDSESSLPVTTLPTDRESECHPLALRHPISGNNGGNEPLYVQLLNQVLLKSCHAYSLWRTEGSSTIEASLLLSQGFPPARSVSAMLDGRWSHWGWSDDNPASGLHITTVDGDTDPWEF